MKVAQRLPTEEELREIGEELRKVFFTWDELGEAERKNLCIYRWAIDHGIKLELIPFIFMDKDNPLWLTIPNLK
jgi:hypothetical protein